MKIVRASKLQDNPYSYNFTVVDTPDINAFAMPAGTIFVTAPFIALADNEAELAGVVSHEIGHVEWAARILRNFRTIHYRQPSFFNIIKTADTAPSVIPGILSSWPMVAGKMRQSLVRNSLERPGTDE